MQTERVNKIGEKDASNKSVAKQVVEEEKNPMPPQPAPKAQAPQFDPYKKCESIFRCLDGHQSVSLFCEPLNPTHPYFDDLAS